MIEYGHDFQVAREHATLLAAADPGLEIVPPFHVADDRALDGTPDQARIYQTGAKAGALTAVVVELPRITASLAFDRVDGRLYLM